jgi:uncharacterized membrane protein
MKIKKIRCYEKFPKWMVLVANLLSIIIYAIGFYIILQFGLICAILYLFYVGLLEINVMDKSCRNCYYYGKICGFGKGKLCSLLFKKGNPKNFLRKKITWINVLPDFLVFIIPLVAGIIILIKDFSFFILFLLIILLILGFFGNSIIRGQIACKYCKQRELGCPALKLFDKNKKDKNENHKSKKL